MFIRMGSSTRRHKQLGIVIHVPGGWMAKVPAVQAEEWIVDAYAAYFVSCGMLANKARPKALQTIQQTFNQGYCKGLRECVDRRAKEYAEMWPQHRAATQIGKKVVTCLVGFDPKLVQQMYVPYQNRGRGGQEFIKGMLADMGRKVSD